MLELVLTKFQSNDEAQLERALKIMLGGQKAPSKTQFTDILLKLVNNGKLDRALELFKTYASPDVEPANLRVTPANSMYSALIFGFSKFGNLKGALELFEHHKRYSEVVGPIEDKEYFSLLLAAGKERNLDAAVNVRWLRRSCCVWLSNTFALLIPQIWMEMKRRRHRPSAYVYAAIIDTLGKCGKYEEAAGMWDVMTVRI